MPSSISVLSAVCIGLAIGYKLKDCLTPKKGLSWFSFHGKKKACQERTHTPDPMLQDNQRFSLHRLEKLFVSYHLSLTCEYSFSRLLNGIEKESYLSILKHIDERIDSPDALFHYLESEPFHIFNMEWVESTGEPYLSPDRVNVMLEEYGVDGPQLDSVEEKVKSLLLSAHEKGVQRFKTFLGMDLTEFMSQYAKGENVDAVFEGLKTNIHNRLMFLL